jgi:hypothetical protein
MRQTLIDEQTPSPSTGATRPSCCAIAERTLWAVSFYLSHIFVLFDFVDRRDTVDEWGYAAAPWVKKAMAS